MKKSGRTAKAYCSLDIETSDFDPSIGEIMEVGLIFFEISKKQIKIIKEWQSTFRCSRSVPPRILALTGITTDELDSSPNFSDKREEIQDLVKDSIIVGHNVNFDIRFLEGYGIKFSGKFVDTLDLAQILLPTAASYNLESLMGFLAIDHKSAHRAIADCMAAIKVLEKFLHHYAAFPEDVKEKLRKIFPYELGMELTDLFYTEFKPVLISVPKVHVNVAEGDEIIKAIQENESVICFPLGVNYRAHVLGAIGKTKEKTLLVVNNKKFLYELWSANLVRPFFENADLFDEHNFKANLVDPELTPEKRMFLAKIIVWQGTNWQSKVLLDLNTSFFGNQYRRLIARDPKAPPEWQADSSARVAAIDYNNFINFHSEPQLAKRKIIILDINNFESALSLSVSKKVSWGDFLFLAKQLELGDHPDIVSKIDLFFGIAILNWRKMGGASSYILVNEAIKQREEYKKIFLAAQGFCAKMAQANERIGSEKLARYIDSLQSFFIDQPNIINYVELRENRLTFFSSPENLVEIAQKIFSRFKKITFTASLGSESLIKYFTDRLGLHNFKVLAVSQQELAKKIEIILANTDSREKILDVVQNMAYPAAYLLPNSQALKEFYESNYRDLHKRYKVLAQGYSGGTNKLFSNFSINENSLLIATDKLVLKQQAGRVLNVRTLVLSRLPFEEFSHPLFAAQAAKYSNQFEEFNIPRALYNFHSIIKVFHTPMLEKIYILDQKIHKNYGKYFLDYLKSLPFIEIK